MHRVHLLPFVLLFAMIFAVVPPPPGAWAGGRDSAPDFELPDLAGAAHRLRDYRGKVVVLNFWASWCLECLAEIPSLNALSSRMKDNGLVVIGVSIDRDPEDVTGMNTPVNYLVLLDQKGDVFVKKYTITRIPVTIIIDRDGRIVEKIFGKRDLNAGSYVAKLETLLRKKESQ